MILNARYTFAGLNRRQIFVFLCFVALLWTYGSLNVLSKDSHQNPSPTPPHPSPSPSTNLSDALFPELPPGDFAPLTRINHIMLYSLFRCIERNDCHENQTKVVILASNYFRDYLYGSRGGESIWAVSTTLALANMGYTYIYTPYPSYLHTIQFYKMFPNLVTHVFMDGDDTFNCYKDINDCALSEQNPIGIPPWKIFSFSFWTGSHNPLGEEWTLSPEDYKSQGKGDTTYLGYSIEDSCRKHAFIPHSERKDQAYIMGKKPFLLTAWTTVDFDAVSNATGMQFVLAYHNDTTEGEWPPVQLPSNHVNFGSIDQTEFMRVLSRTRVLIGDGDPVTSPSPYDALCLGVPFINPIKRWDPENPSDKSRWDTQHDPLRELDPPYVYNVFKGDTQGFVQAVKDAVSHPINSYVLERMTMSAVENRLAAILERDWYSQSQSLKIDWEEV